MPPQALIVGESQRIAIALEAVDVSCGAALPVHRKYPRAIRQTQKAHGSDWCRIVRPDSDRCRHIDLCQAMNAEGRSECSVLHITSQHWLIDREGPSRR